MLLSLSLYKVTDTCERRREENSIWKYSLVKKMFAWLLPLRLIMILWFALLSQKINILVIY